MACLVVDIGNTSTALGVYSNGAVRNRARLATAGSGAAEIRRVVERVAARRRLRGAVLCSVVPDRNRVWIECLRRVLGAAPLIVGHKLELGVRVACRRPAAVGADRLANACGAAERHGVPVIVADFGTALTFSAVTKDRAFIGGAIAPGLPLMRDYLLEKTALLPRIKLAGRIDAVGRNTRGAMRIGARVGYRGLVREITAHLLRCRELAGARLCATGGYAAPALEGVDLPYVLDPDLTLCGMGTIFELNRCSRAGRGRQCLQ